MADCGLLELEGVRIRSSGLPDGGRYLHVTGEYGFDEVAVFAVTSTTVVLVRHGESRAQVDGLIAGHSTCTGLSPRGRRQAEALRDRLADTGELGPIDAVYTSVQARAVETAGIIGPALGTSTSATGDCTWCELHPGVAEGLTWAQLRRRHPADGDPDDPYRPRVAGAETWSGLYERVGRGMRHLLRAHGGQRIVVVGHGGTVGASLVALGEVPVERGVEVVRSIANTSITEWLHTGTVWRLLRLSDATHLAHLPDPDDHQAVPGA